MYSVHLCAQWDIGDGCEMMSKNIVLSRPLSPSAPELLQLDPKESGDANHARSGSEARVGGPCSEGAERHTDACRQVGNLRPLPPATFKKKQVACELLELLLVYLAKSFS